MSKIARITHDKKLLLADEIVEDNTKIRLDSDGRLDIDEIIEYPAELEGGRNLATKESILNWHSGVTEISSEYGSSFKYSSGIVKDNIFPDLDFEANAQYTISFKSIVEDTVCWVRFRVYYTDGTYEQFYYNTTELTSHIFTTKENKTIDSIGHTYGNVGYNVIIYNFKLEKGSQATPWTPAPEDLGISYSEDIDSFGTKLFEGRLMVSELIEDCSFDDEEFLLDFGEILEGKISMGGLTGISGASSSDVTDIPSDLFPLYYDGWHEFYDYDPPINNLFPMFAIQYDTETSANAYHAFISYNNDGSMVEDRLFEYDNSYHNYRIIIGFPLMTQTVGVKGEFVLRKGSATGEVLYKQYYDVTVGKDQCYLTTAMVGYFDKDDDGIELTAMRELRSHSGYKYQDVLEEYTQVSPIIIRGIEQSEDKDYYYNMIKDVVDNIVIWVADKEWGNAETAYLELYYCLKEKFGGGEDGTT